MIYDLESKTARELREIVKIQLEEYQALQSKCDALKKELKVSDELIDNYDFVDRVNGKELAIRGLEQQIKGIEDAMESASYIFEYKVGDLSHQTEYLSVERRGAHTYISAQKRYLKQLREQAKAIRGGE